MFGMEYILGFRFSLKAAGLSLLYFFVILLYAIRKNRKWVRKASLYNLLYYGRQTEKVILHGGISAIVAFLMSVLTGCAGILLMYFQPLQKGFDIFVGIICLVLFLMGFFVSVPAFFITQFGNRDNWKYRKNRLVVLRQFTAKIHSTSIVMGVLSVLFMLSFTFMGVGSAVYTIANKNVEQSVFDILILHRAELQDFSAICRMQNINMILI